MAKFTVLDAVSVIVGSETVPRSEAMRTLVAVVVRQQRALHELGEQGEKLEVEQRELTQRLQKTDPAQSYELQQRLTDTRDELADITARLHRLSESMDATLSIIAELRTELRCRVNTELGYGGQGDAKVKSEASYSSWYDEVVAYEADMVDETLYSSCLEHEEEEGKQFYLH